MFRRLRLQFITIASLAILFILVFTVGIINTVRSFQTEQEISKVLNTLTENNGSFGKTKKIEINQGREIPSDSFRFFSATLSGDEVQCHRDDNSQKYDHHGKHVQRKSSLLESREEARSYLQTDRVDEQYQSEFF